MAKNLFEKECFLGPKRCGLKVFLAKHFLIAHNLTPWLRYCSNCVLSPVSKDSTAVFLNSTVLFLSFAQGICTFQSKF